MNGTLAEAAKSEKQPAAQAWADKKAAAGVDGGREVGARGEWAAGTAQSVGAVWHRLH